ncbi:fasciclin domain-containing protein [Mucilaginibacter sp. HMF5004]|uniref:fasciclin domain-containing protein n=1 Tax=Mucilaginibacter rivuli TaxID=2857527 RepID=UPI001C5F571F|nr:fasciclin domain-containing protein [Mucilaginibacter rivuli]MBW4888975.1 fasciclin domain-containing protein [Mucilaginibacter rivuli]
MNKNIRHSCTTLFVLLVIFITGCKDQWDQRDLISDTALQNNLSVQIAQNSDLSIFYQYVIKTGYDKILAASKTYTVFAPNNTAMQGVASTILTDSAKLKQFIGNHIVNLAITTNMAASPLRLKTLNGKNGVLTSGTFEGSNILKANLYANNGILHIIDAAVIPKMSIWEFINSQTALGQKQIAYIKSQNYVYQDTTLATVTGVDGNGRPILKPGTGLVNKNYYLDQTADLRDEDQQFTYIILTDAAFDAENNKVTKYFTTSTADSTKTLAALNVTKDLVIPGVYQQPQLPDTLLSVKRVKVPLLRGTTIVQSYNASNGIVYVMTGVNFRLTDKIPTIVIQGEDAAFFARTDRAANIAIRLRNDPSGVPYKDLFISGTGLPASFYSGYRVRDANSVTYKVYQRAINEQLSAGTAATATAPPVLPTPILFNQQISVFSPFTAVTNFGYQSVAYMNYNEVLVGTYVNTRYGYLKITASGANSTSVNANSISLDYLKFVPVLP